MGKLLDRKLKLRVKNEKRAEKYELKCMRSYMEEAKPNLHWRFNVQKTGLAKR